MYTFGWFAYATCPGMRKHNEVLMQISRRRRDEMLNIFHEKQKKDAEDERSERKKEGSSKV